MKWQTAAVGLALGLCALVAPGPQLHAQSAADIFNGQALQHLEIDIHTADWSKLKQEFQSNDYYPADITWNGIKAYNAGIRSRGVGSRNQNKPSIKIDFNHYASGQTYLGLKALVLDNLVQDPSGVHEATSMWFFARLGIPAPREAHTLVYVNGNYVGVYSMVEPIDKNLIARVFGNEESGNQNDGLLSSTRPTSGGSRIWVELEPYKRYFGQTHETEPDEPVSPAGRPGAVDQREPAEELTDGRPPIPGPDTLPRLQNFISEIDGFAGKWGMNNFYLYRLQHQPQHRIIAWDDDLTFLDPSYDVMSFQESNVLVSKLMAVPEYRALYFETLSEAVKSANERVSQGELGALELEIRRELDLIDGAMLADTQRPYTDAEYLDAREFMKQFAPRRARYVECEVARLTGTRPCA